MSGTTLLRGFAVLLALAASACATTQTPSTAESLLDSARVPHATVASCAAANMALVCESATLGRTRASSLDRRCGCGDRNELTTGFSRF